MNFLIFKILPQQNLYLLVEKEKELISYNVIDTFIIKTYKKPIKNKSYILINDHITDTLSRPVVRIPIYFKNYIFFNYDLIDSEKNNLDKFMYSLIENKFYSYNISFQVDRSFQQFYRIIDYKIFFIDPILKKEYLGVDLTEYLIKSDAVKKEKDDFGKIYPLIDIFDVIYINKEQFLVILCTLGDFVGCYGYKYLLINRDTINDITNFFGIYSNISYQSEPPLLEFISENKKCLRMSINSKSSANKISLVYEISLGKFFRVLNMSNFTFLGINIQKSIITNNFLSLNINHKELIIPYKFIPELDMAMYKVYNDSILKKEDLKNFGKYELGILRNLIFAKHNYDFSSEFYQAYFNLYEFYNNEEKRKTRTKDINSKLTAADRKNLELIKSIESIR